MFVFLTVLAIIDVRSQASPSVKDDFEFSEITFHSSKCNGTCPDISMSINSDGKISLLRILFNKKGQIDTVRSGGFKGTLSSEEFSKLIMTLRTVNWQKVEFPNVTCCDGAVVQILISVNGNYRKLKSMTPPAEVNGVVKYLTNLATTVQLPTYKGAMDFEESLD